MRSICLIFEMQHKEKVLSLLDDFATESFLHDGEKQWNYTFEKNGTFYISCEEYTVNRLGDEEYELSEDENADDLVIRDKQGMMYGISSEPDTIKYFLSIVNPFILHADISGRADSTLEVNLLIETFLSKIDGYAMDEYSDHLWTFDEIKNNEKFNGHKFFDFCGWYDEINCGPFAEFGIIERIDSKKDYGIYEPQKYDAIKIADNALCDWYPEVAELNSYFHRLSRPEKGLARYGITLIPPESLDKFYEIVANHTMGMYIRQKERPLELITKAKQENKFIIHFGI